VVVGSTATLRRGDELTVLDVRCTCPARRVDEEDVAGFEVVFPTSGFFRRRTRDGELDVDATTAYVGRPGVDHRIEHVTNGDRGIVVLVGEQLADELGLDGPEVRRRDRAHDRVVAGAAAANEETWLAALAALTGERARPVTGEHERAVALVREAIASAPAERWALRELASVAGYAPHHLSRVFRAVTGATVSAHRERVRLAHASELVAAGMPLADVAATCGYADHAHLTRATSRQLGIPPSQLR
jgi:AraC-like DNA-binding protein